MDRTADSLRVSPEFRARLKAVCEDLECWWNFRTLLWHVYVKVLPGVVDLRFWKRLKDNGVIVTWNGDNYRILGRYSHASEAMLMDLRRRMQVARSGPQETERIVEDAARQAELSNAREADLALEQFSEVAYPALKRDVGDLNLSLIPKASRDRAVCGPLPTSMDEDHAA